MGKVEDKTGKSFGMNMKAVTVKEISQELLNLTPKEQLRAQGSGQKADSCKCSEVLSKPHNLRGKFHGDPDRIKDPDRSVRSVGAVLQVLTA